MGLFDFVSKKEKERKYYLGWQNVLLDTPVNRLIMSKQEIVDLTADKLRGDLKIIQDSLKLVMNTMNPDVFFTRMNLLVQVANRIQKYEPYLYPDQKEYTVLYFQVIEKYQEYVRKFLLRYYSDTYSKIEQMKTIKGKMNRWNSWYESLRIYYCHMNEDNIQLVEADYRLNKNSLTGKNK